jgi:PTH1 family peptidyl-tRNA hydrolase
MSDKEPWLVIGLGNPGPEYERTRHNIGAMVLDSLGASLGTRFTKHKRALAQVAETHIDGHRVILAKPMSYMNTSGGPTKALATFYKVPSTQLIVLHDELDIDGGAIRLKFGGGDNGHNGLKSIRSSLATGDWYRIRLGIGRPPGRMNPADFVLKNFASAERDMVQDLCDRGSDAVTTLITQGLAPAQNLFNS